MKCSTCQGHDLQPKKLEDGLIAAECSFCNGMLISLINYRFWADNYAENMLSVEEDDILIKDSESVRCCPKCSRLMTKYQISASSDNRVDLCSGCDEVWLDSGEWQLIKRLDIAEKLTNFFTDSWQRQIRKDKELESLKEHYQGLIGVEDFSKVSDFKKWLDIHPEKQSILHYVNTRF